MLLAFPEECNYDNIARDAEILFSLKTDSEMSVTAIPRCSFSKIPKETFIHYFVDQQAGMEKFPKAQVQHYKILVYP